MPVRAPGKAGRPLRDNQSRRVPYWRPWGGEDGEGDIVLVASDRTHKATIETPEGETVMPYQFKGYIPLTMLPADHEAHEVFRALCSAARARYVMQGRVMPNWLLPESQAPAGDLSVTDRPKREVTRRRKPAPLKMQANATEADAEAALSRLMPAPVG